MGYGGALDLVVSRALGPSRFGLVVSATSVSGVIGVLLASALRPTWRGILLGILSQGRRSSAPQLF